MKNCEELVAGEVSAPLSVAFEIPNTYPTNGIVNKIGACFYVDESGVSQANRRISDKLKKNSSGALSCIN